MSEKNTKNWAEVEEVGVYWLMRFSLLLRLIFGGIVFRAVLIPIVTYFFLFNKNARNASLDYLAHIHRQLPHSLIKPTLWYSFRHFMSFAQAITDKLTAWSGKITPADVEIHGRKEFIDSLKENQGALILGSHLGNMEVSRALAGLHHKAKLNILVHTKHAKNFNRLLNSQMNSECQMELIQVTDLSPAFAILLDQKISQGEFVFIVGDRIPVNNNRTLRADFLGEKAEFAQGPFILASLLKCPVYTLFCLKQDKKYHIYFEHFADQIKLPRKNREEALQTFVNSFAARLEKYCLLTPLQWFNFYFYWKQPHQ